MYRDVKTAVCTRGVNGVFLSGMATQGGVMEDSCDTIGLIRGVSNNLLITIGLNKGSILINDKLER